jgi:hypothetical protein
MSQRGGNRYDHTRTFPKWSPKDDAG